MGSRLWRRVIAPKIDNLNCNFLAEHGEPRLPVLKTGWIFCTEKMGSLLKLRPKLVINGAMRTAIGLIHHFIQKNFKVDS